MSLAGEDELQATRGLRELAQPLGVVKEQRRPLVRRRPSREAQREEVRTKARRGAIVHHIDEHLLGLPVGRAHRLGGDAPCVAQGEAAATPVRDVAVVEPRERR
jgi:hypothetical protein